VKPPLRLLLKLLLAVAVLFVLWLVAPTDEKRVRKVLREMAADASFAPGDGNIARVARLESLLSRVASDAEIEVGSTTVPVSRLAGKDEIRQVALASHGLQDGLKVEVFDIEVTVEPGGLEATAALTASVKSGASELVTAQELEFLMVKQENRWRMRRVRPRATFGQ